MTWGTSAFVSTKPTVWSSLHWGFKTTEKCHSKSKKQWAIISLICLAYPSDREQENLVALTNYVINCKRGSTHSPFSSCYGCISWVLRRLSPSVWACPFSLIFMKWVRLYENIAPSIVTNTSLSDNELMNRIWEHRSSHWSLLSTVTYTNTSVDIFSLIKPVISIMLNFFLSSFILIH